jgi:hypothetical protein
MQFAGVDHHGPLFGEGASPFCATLVACAHGTARSEGIEHRFGPKTQRGDASDLQESVFCCFPLPYSPFGLSMWQSQQ